jgi:hypothetical protein
MCTLARNAIEIKLQQLVGKNDVVGCEPSSSQALCLGLMDGCLGPHLQRQVPPTLGADFGRAKMGKAESGWSPTGLFRLFRCET